MKMNAFYIFLVVAIVYYLGYYEPHRPLRSEKVDDLRKTLRPILDPDEYERIKVYDMKEEFDRDVAYTKSKKKIWICSKSKNGIPEDKEVLLYVLIHEYAHAINADSYQHDKNFQKTFRELLHKADQKGIKYRKADRICGHCVSGNCKK